MGAAESQLSSSDVKQNQVNFLINGKEYSVNPEQKFGPKSILVDYIRDEAGLKGTKYMCREGGCGACVVTVKSKDPVTGADVTRAINSCLTPVFSCDGWDISTIEKLGNKKDGYHPIQKRLTSFSGTQCGYCTPGMIMNMYSLMESKKDLKAKEIEDQFDGNLCRCTGYRPILDAFKSMASDASEELRRKCIEVEECGKAACQMKNQCTLNAPAGSTWACKQEQLEPEILSYGKVHISLKSGEQWVKPDNLESLFEAIQKFQAEGLAYRLVGGNTATGIHKSDGPYAAYVDMNNIPDLRKNTIDKSGVILGGGTTLINAVEALKKSAELEGYEYCAAVSKHLLRVANVPIRNAATIAGNLMIKNAHKEFPSDVFILLESLGAKVTIASAPSLQAQHTISEFIQMDMKGKVIVSIHLPSLPASVGYHFRSFKITKRYQNAHAYVNAGLLFKVDPSTFKFLEKPRICFGGINPTFIHASETETFLQDKTCDASTLTQALEILEKEVEPENKPPDATPAYRKALTQSLLYKTILGILGAQSKSNLQSGGKDIEHVLTRGKQTYDVDESNWPINKPVTKLEGPIQCSGEAEYVNDIHKLPGELAGAFVLTTVAKADLKSVDASEALKMPGVVGFMQAKDIPGTNNYYNIVQFAPAEPEEVFVKDKVTAAGQAIGLILAESRETALSAAKLVKVEYANVQKPVLSIPPTAAAENVEDKTTYASKVSIEQSKNGAPKNTIKGEVRTGGQYHFTMETQVTLCVPKDGVYDVYSATQWMEHIQAAVATVLNIPNNNINVQVRRIGGGYGCKASRASQIAAACAVASYNTNKPVRVVLDLETNMKLIGKRLPYYCSYEVGFDDNGKIESLNGKIVCDTGNTSNEVTSMLAMLCMQNAYDATGWKLESGKANTNTVPNTFCRAPGSTQGIMAIEAIMDHIAAHLKKDPFEVRTANFIKEGDTLLTDPTLKLCHPRPNLINTEVEPKFEGENYLHRLVEEMKVSGDYEERKKFVNAFNQNNRWKKRGLAMLPMRYPQHYFSHSIPAQVAIYHVDGSVSVSHGGIEMGQGINTKVAQVVAKYLDVPLEKITVKPSNDFVAASAVPTGGAATSELACFAAMEACKMLTARLAPIKEKMKDATWPALISAAYVDGIDISARYLPSARDGLKVYHVWGLNLTEVEVDMLTGEYKIVRLDQIQDAGKSLSQEVDIGQIEGCLVMGLGLWTTEKLYYDENTGELLTPNTWDYKVPLPKDIPEDLRITLLKNAPNPFGILSSKATGEPPLCLSVCVLSAMRNAIESARADAGNTEYFPINAPITPEDIVRLSLSTKDKFVL